MDSRLGGDEVHQEEKGTYDEISGAASVCVVAMGDCSLADQCIDEGLEDCGTERSGSHD